MNRFIPVALMIGGVLLIYFGVKGSGSLSSDFSRLFTGAPTEKAVWMLVGGILASAAGLVGLGRCCK